MTSGGSAVFSMPVEAHARAAAMRRHWWYRGRSAAVASLLRRAGVQPGGRVLDYGCGAGHMGRILSRFGDVTGVELSPAALTGGRYDHYQRTVCVPPDWHSLPDAPFDLIACLDVLEHVPDDAGLLRRLAGQLTPSGRMVIAAPLRPDLFCEFDVRAGHLRRYTPAALAALCAGAGLLPLASGGYLVALLPVAAAHRRGLLRGRARGDDGVAMPPMPLNALLSAVAVAEGRLGRWLSLPAGLSQLIVLGRGPA